MTEIQRKLPDPPLPTDPGEIEHVIDLLHGQAQSVRDIEAGGRRVPAPEAICTTAGLLKRLAEKELRQRGLWSESAAEPIEPVSYGYPETLAELWRNASAVEQGAQECIEDVERLLKDRALMVLQYVNGQHIEDVTRNLARTNRQKKQAAQSRASELRQQGSATRKRVRDSYLRHKSSGFEERGMSQRISHELNMPVSTVTHHLRALKSPNSAAD